MVKYVRLYGLVALLWAVSGCAVKPHTASVPHFSSSAIVGVEWVATVVEGVPYMQSPRPQLRWTSAEAIAGTGGCNAFAGRANVTAPNKLLVGSMVPIGKPCMTPPGAQEDMFFKALEQTQQARLEAGQLLLMAEDGRVLIRMSKAVANP